MRLQRLSAEGWRNLEPFELDTDAGYVVFVGRNAQGKTNALEAIYLLCTLKPLRTRRLRELVRWGEARAIVAGSARHRDLTRRYRVEIEDGRRRTDVDGKAPASLGDYFGGIRAIAFTPQDVGIVTGEPARRRAWVDRAAFTAHPVHLEVVRTHRRALDQKAAALRGPADDGVLDVIESRLAIEAARLAARRVAILGELAPHVARIHEEIAGGHGRLTLRYRTDAEGDSVEARAEALRARMRDARRRERERRMPLVGPQGDEVELLIDDRPARAYGSQGQVRSVVLALKLAEMVAARERGEVPLFLLDDVGSELDADRTRRLVAALAELGAQVIATTTARAHLAHLPAGDTRWVDVDEGRLQPARD